MFCPKLNAPERVIKRLFIEAVYNNDENKIHRFFTHPHVQSFGGIMPINYTTLGSSSSIGVEFSSGNTLFLQDSNSVRSFEPVLMATISPNNRLTKETLYLLENSSKASFDFYICAAIKENDYDTAELISKNKNITLRALRFNEEVFNLDYIYKFVQLGFYCGSNNFMHWLAKLYSKKLISARVSNLDTKDIFGIDYLTNNFQSESDSLHLREIVSANIEKLNERYINHKEKLHDYLFYFFVDNLKSFGLSDDEIKATIQRYGENKKTQKKNSKRSTQKNSKKTNCVIQ